MIYPAKLVGVSVQCPVADIYKFASNPENLPHWASGLSNSSLTKSGEEWISESSMGKVKIKFAPQNSFGILDHDVTLPSGEVVYNPLRVFKNGDGSEIVFTVYRLPNITAADFEKDVKHVEQDLHKLKSILENSLRQS